MEADFNSGSDCQVLKYSWFGLAVVLAYPPEGRVTTPLPVALLVTVRTRGIGWWSMAAPDSVPWLTALEASH